MIKFSWDFMILMVCYIAYVRLSELDIDKKKVETEWFLSWFSLWYESYDSNIDEKVSKSVAFNTG